MKNCKNCNACKMLYMQYISFFKVNKYYCIEYKRVTQPDNCCDKWNKKLIEFDVSSKRFDEAERDIKILQQLLIE